MSSLRIDALRLVWLEAFIAVADAENISKASRELSCDQSTITRYMQALRKWSGKELIVPGKMTDPDDPGVNIKLTAAGHELYDLAITTIDDLTGFRTEVAQRQELLVRMKTMIGKMRKDLESRRPSQTILSVKDKVEFQIEVLAKLDEQAPSQQVEGLYPSLRRFFATYEDQLTRERRRPSRKGKKSAKDFDMSQYRRGRTSSL